MKSKTKVFNFCLDGFVILYFVFYFRVKSEISLEIISGGIIGCIVGMLVSYKNTYRYKDHYIKKHLVVVNISIFLPVVLFILTNYLGSGLLISESVIYLILGMSYIINLISLGLLNQYIHNNYIR